MFRPKRQTDCPTADAAPFTPAAEKSALISWDYSEPPRLEPYYSEVKRIMADAKVSEQKAERMARKILIENAVYRIEDPHTRNMARALLALL